MTGNPDRSLTIDTHHHILPDFFWQETENAHAPVGGPILEPVFEELESRETVVYVHPNPSP